jgi:hypothetical protein
MGATADGTNYLSTNSGAAWTPMNLPLTNSWQGIACSADGATIVVAGGNLVYISQDSGVTWYQTDAPASLIAWSAVACSGDKSNIVLASSEIFTLKEPWLPPPTVPSPRLKTAETDSAFGVSWLVPSTRFVLEETSDLASGNWTNAPSAPTLNLTNLNYQWTASQSQNNAFFRLRQQ